MDTLKPMDIIVTADKTPISWWIRWWTSSEWSHVLTVSEDPEYGYTTTVQGYKRKLLSEYLKGKTYGVYRFPDLDEKAIQLALKYCRNQLDKPYAYMDVVKLFVQNMRGQGVKSLKGNSNKYFCSELVAMLYRLMGVTLAPQKKKQPSAYTPSDCVDDMRLIQI